VRYRRVCATVWLLLAFALSSRAQPPAPSAAPLDPTQLAKIAPLVEAAIAAHQLPGAVIVAGRGDRVEYRHAFGSRALVPAVEPMSLDTIFDIASLTKVVATTTAVMQLVEDGRLRLADRVSDYIPGFERYGKDRITIRHLLTHTSGLRPDLEL
jgi:CubicO group peptidase (beta-lactamase class C family)